jgi:hypothetical protein
MSSKWMRFKRDTLLDGIFAIIVAAVLCVLFFGDQLPSSALGAKLPEPKLVAYFVSWHVTARGSKMVQSSTPGDNGVSTEAQTERDIVDATGSAVTRFRQYQDGGTLHFHDTHYLTFTERENWDWWQRNTTPSGHDCTIHNSHTIADPGSYAGYRAVVGQTGGGLLEFPPERRNGVTVMRRPFHFLTYVLLSPIPIIDHMAHEGYGHTTIGSCVEASSSVGERNAIGGFSYEEIGHATRLDLQADPNDPSSFFLHARYSILRSGSHDMNVEVEWTAHASLMGKCAERDGPIQEDDPVVLSEGEDVHIDTDDSDIAPDSKTKVHITVTCEGVPVEGAKVKIEVEPVDSSGGHIHVNDRPKGKLDGKNLTGADPSITRTTDKDGKVKGVAGVTFAPPGKDPISRCLGVSGDYKVTATSEKFKDRKDSTMIVVRLKENLVMLGKSQNYDICADSVHGCSTEGPWGTTDHPDSEYGTAGTIQAFQGVATDFWNQQQSHNQLLQSCKKNPWPMKKVSFNDIALPWGGLFDMNSTWRQPHKTHGRGQGGDFNHFRGNSCDQGACLSCGGATVNFDAFLWNVLKFTAQPKYGHWDGEVNSTGELHLHVEDQGQGPPKDCPADN